MLVSGVVKLIFSLLITASLALAIDAPKLERNAKGDIVIVAPDGSHARYTIDGSAPHAKSGPYLAPIVLDAGGTVKAVAVSPDRKTVSAPTELVVGPQGKPKPSSIVPCTQDRDFPTYDWAIRHAQVTELTTKKKASLVFIGDSITQMFGGEPHDRSQPGKDVWEKYYGSRNATNLGFGYDYTENALWRIQHGELDGAAAKAVVVNIGTNNMGKNTPDEILAGVKSVLAEVRRSQPAAKILLLGIYPRGAKPDATREKVAKTNTLLAELNGKDNVTFLDVSAKLIEPDGTISKDTMRDYLHPTAKGYETIAEAVEPTLKTLLGE
jgi:lysophospholipase L1-like esterase